VPPPASIAAAQLRVAQARGELRSGLRALGATLSQPCSLLAAAAAGAVVGFSLVRVGGSGALARGLVAGVLRQGMHAVFATARYRLARRASM